MLKQDADAHPGRRGAQHHEGADHVRRGVHRRGRDAGRLSAAISPYLEKNDSPSTRRPFWAARSSGEPCDCFGSSPRKFHRGRRRHALLSDRRGQVRQTDHRSGHRPVHQLERRRQMRAGFLRFHHAEQPVGRDAHRLYLLRARRARGAKAPAIRTRRSLLRRAQQEVERGRSRRVQGAARPSVGCLTEVTIQFEAGGAGGGGVRRFLDEALELGLEVRRTCGGETPVLARKPPPPSPTRRPAPLGPTTARISVIASFMSGD